MTHLPMSKNELLANNDKVSGEHQRIRWSDWLLKNVFNLITVDRRFQPPACWQIRSFNTISVDHLLLTNPAFWQHSSFKTLTVVK